MRSGFRHGRKHRRRSALGLALAASAVGLGACENLLDVELSGRVTEAALLRPEMAPIMVSSAIADFECAYSMATVTTASMEDAWWRMTGYWGGWAEYREDRPDSGECATEVFNDSWYQAFQTSRFQSEQAYEHISGWTAEQVPNREQYLATVAAYAGLVYQFFGETYCEIAVDVGPAMTPEETLIESERWFTAALDHVANTGDFGIATTTSVKQLALLGRARARFALAHVAEGADAESYYVGAAADASQIRPDFIAYVTRDASVRRRWNHVHSQLNVSQYSSIAGPVQWPADGQFVKFTGYRQLIIDEEGRTTIDGYPVIRDTTMVGGKSHPVLKGGIQGYPAVGEGVLDPRVPAFYTGQFGQDGVTDNWKQSKYTAYSDPIPLARWAEAQLILAEVDARNGQGASAISRINALRDVHSLPHYEGPATSWENGLREVIIEERRREFFFEVRFLADKLRYGLWFPEGVGSNHKAFTYGAVTCFLMPESEYETNPNLPDP